MTYVFFAREIYSGAFSLSLSFNSKYNLINNIIKK